MKFNDSIRLTILLPVIALILVLFLLIGWVLYSLPQHKPGLSEAVFYHLPESGVSAPVTAVLLNFRGYDTLLELAVLLAAMLGTWQLGKYRSPPLLLQPGPILDGMVSLLTPVIVLIAGYVLWLGGHSSGGAFQAGAILAGAGVLIIVSRPEQIRLYDNYGLRLILVAGPVVFTLIAGSLSWLNGALLKYNPNHAGFLILAIEAVSTLSIGLTLTLLFAGGRPRRRGDT